MKSEHPLARLCAAFGVKRSGYHAWVKAESGPKKKIQRDRSIVPFL
jgi:hypothetical protein